MNITRITDSFGPFTVIFLDKQEDKFSDAAPHIKEGVETKIMTAHPKTFSFREGHHHMAPGEDLLLNVNPKREAFMKAQRLREILTCDHIDLNIIIEGFG